MDAHIDFDGRRVTNVTNLMLAADLSCNEFHQNQIPELLQQEEERETTNQQNSKGSTALLILMFNGGSVENIKALLEAGANPNIANENGATASFFAQVHPNKHQVTQLLRQHGAQIEAEQAR